MRHFPAGIAPLPKLFLQVHRPSCRTCLASLPVLLATTLASLTGCHSPQVSMTIFNASAQPVSLIEVDYPDASFGLDSLAAGASYHYNFQIAGDGPTRISWTDATRQGHSSAGPALHQGQQGALQATLSGAAAHWQSKLRSH